MRPSHSHDRILCSWSISARPPENTSFGCPCGASRVPSTEYAPLSVPDLDGSRVENRGVAPSSATGVRQTGRPTSEVLQSIRDQLGFGSCSVRRYGPLTPIYRGCRQLRARRRTVPSSTNAPQCYGMNVQTRPGLVEPSTLSRPTPHHCRLAHAPLDFGPLSAVCDPEDTRLAFTHPESRHIA